jgi:hypothetical protein
VIETLQTLVNVTGTAKELYDICSQEVDIYVNSSGKIINMSYNEFYFLECYIFYNIPHIF